MDLSRSAVKIFLANGLSMAISFAGIAYFSQELGSSVMGTFFLFQAVLGILTIPADFGVNRAVMKRLSEDERAGRVLATAVVIKIVILFFISSLIFAFRAPINRYIGGELALYLVIVLVLQTFGKLSLRVLEGEMRVGDTALPLLARRIVFVSLGVILLSEGLEVLSLIYGLLLGLATMTVWNVYRSSITITRPTIKQAQSLYDFSKYSFISSLGGYAFSWTDAAIIGFLLTNSDVGVYEVAWRITAIMTLFSSSISNTIYPQVSKWDAEDKGSQIEQILPKAIAFPLFFTVPGLLGVVIFSDPILRILFGVEFTSGWFVLIILMAGRSPQAFLFIFSRVLNGIDRPDLGAKAALIAITSNVLLNITLIIQYGIAGAAIATSVSFILSAVIHAYYLSDFISIQMPLFQIAGIVTASFGMAGILWYVQSKININGFPQLIAVVILGVVVYTIFTLLIPPTRQMITESVQRLS